MGFFFRSTPPPAVIPAPGTLAAAAPLTEIAKTAPADWTAADARAVAHALQDLERLRVATLRGATPERLRHFQRTLTWWVAGVVGSIIAGGLFLPQGHAWWTVTIQAGLALAALAVLAALQCLVTEVRARRWTELLAQHADPERGGAGKSGKSTEREPRVVESAATILHIAADQTLNGGMTVDAPDTEHRRNGKHRPDGVRSKRQGKKRS